MKFTKESLSISEAVLNSAKENPDKTALNYMNIKVKYKTLLKRIEALSASFYHMGLRKGDIVLVLLPNVPQAVYALYALNRIGAVPAFASPLSAEAEIEMYLAKTKADVIIAIDSLREKLQSVFVRTGAKKLVITSILDEFKFFDIPPKADEIPFAKLCKNKSKGSIYLNSPKSHDTAVILFSGGTTGTPKAVELTNLNLNALAQGTEEACGYNVRGVRMLSALPVFHGFGLGICIHTVLYFGGECILVPRFDADKTGRIIKKTKPQYMAVVPAMLRPLIGSKPLAKADFSKLYGVFSGGDSLKTELEEEFNKFLLKHNCQIKIRQGYGLTECVASSCLMPADNIKKESVGKPYPDTLYKIVRQNTTEEVSLGEKGEICISGKTVMKGYFCDENETRKALKVHSDGRIWLHTGDMGFMDNEGYVYFKQRLKRVIITNGYNVYPSEIENALLKHRLIKECCAVGISDERKIQAVAVFAVLKNPADESERTKTELLNYLDGFVSRQAKPKFIFFASNIPRTALGKTAYTELQHIAENIIENED